MADAARLRELIAIEEEKRVPNGQGGWKTDWLAAPGAERVPAEIIGLSGDEALRNGIERSVTQYRVRIRKRSSLAVTPKNRLNWNGAPMAVRSVMPDPREPRAYLVLIAEIGNGS